MNTDKYLELSPNGPFMEVYHYYQEYPVEVIDIWEKIRQDISPFGTHTPESSKIGNTLYTALTKMILDTMVEEKMLARDMHTTSGYRPITNLPFRAVDVPVKDQINATLKQGEYIQKLIADNGEDGAKCCYLTFTDIPESQANKIYGAIREGLEYAMNQQKLDHAEEKTVELTLSFLCYQSGVPSNKPYDYAYHVNCREKHL
ncbi:MAG: hypothetical protein OXT67_12540 [Zetaproteobacteria bacterium]|nr:hypothetical protein [Zetaproteobacteria bacterium]